MRARDDVAGVAVFALVIALGASAVATFVLMWPIAPSAGGPSGARQPSVYNAESVWLVVLITVAAVVGLSHRPVRSAMVVLCGGFALGIAGMGAVAVRRWQTSAGFTTAAGNLTELRVVAGLMCAAGLVGAVACFRAVALTVPFTWDRNGVVQVATGATTLGLVPLAMGWEERHAITQLGAHALMYGIPWAVTITAGACATPSVRRAALLAPVVAGPFLLFGSMVPAPRHELGYVVAVGLVAACRAVQITQPNSGTDAPLTLA